MLMTDSTYTLHICGLTRELPIIPASSRISIASFVILGDTKLIETTAEALVEKLKKDIDIESIDYLVCPEAKSIPLVHVMARILDLDYIVVRKSVKTYMQNPASVSSYSITTEGDQMLVLDGKDAEHLKNSNIVIVDDVVSTGGSLLALEKLLHTLHCRIAAKAAILLEDGGYKGQDLIYLKKLPVFTNTNYK